MKTSTVVLIGVGVLVAGAAGVLLLSGRRADPAAPKSSSRSVVDSLGSFFSNVAAPLGFGGVQGGVQGMGMGGNLGGTIGSVGGPLGSLAGGVMGSAVGFSVGSTFGSIQAAAPGLSKWAGKNLFR